MSQSFAPRPMQRLMIDHMGALPRAGVWASMGTGKTSATLSLIDGLQVAGIETKPALVLAPLRVAQSTWPDEAAKWDQTKHLGVAAIVGDARARSAQLANAKNGQSEIYTLNYENLPWLMESLDGGSWPFGMVVADESTRLKSFRLGGSKSRRARAIAAVAHKHIDRWVNLTGTPSPNGLIDLWGQTWFLDAGQRLGRTFTAFEQRWFRKGRDGFSTEVLPYSQEQIEDAVRDLHLTIDARDYFDIAEPIVNVVRVRLPPKARAQYREMERTMFLRLSENVEIEAFNAASLTMKCLQIANGALYTDDTGTSWERLHDAKLQALESIVSEASGAPVLVAYHFKSDLARLRSAFPQGRHLDADPQTIRDWNAGLISVLFAHPASAGHGLNLQDGGNIIAFFGHWWNLEEYQQIIERIGPMRQRQAGHDRPVFIHHIVAEDTVDEDVLARRETKREVQDLLLEAMKRRNG